MSSKLLKDYLGSKMNFLEECNKTIDEIHEDDDNTTPSPDVQRKILIIAKNFSLILEHLKSGSLAREEFVEFYPYWIEKRMDTIEKLKEIADIMNNDKFTFNIHRLVYSITSFAGGGLMLASAPFTGGLSVPLALIGAGSVANLGTTIAETRREKENVKRAQKIIEEDKVLLKKFGGWLEHSEILSKAQSEVLKIDIVRDMYSSIKKLVDKGMEIQNTHERKSFIESQIKKIVKCLKEKKYICVRGIKTLLSLLIGILVLRSADGSRILLKCADLAVRAVAGFVLLTGTVFDVADLVCDSTAYSKPAVKAGGRRLFAAIGMSLDAANILLTSVDIHKGSFSSEAKKILSIAKELENEAKVLKNIYKEMDNSQDCSRY